MTKSFINSNFSVMLKSRKIFCTDDLPYAEVRTLSYDVYVCYPDDFLWHKVFASFSLEQSLKVAKSYERKFHCSVEIRMVGVFPLFDCLIMVKVDVTRLLFLIEARKDLKGSTSYYLTIVDIKLHLHSMDSVLDVINSNSYGYVTVK